MLKLLRKFKLIACRNKVRPFIATVQASDWLIKCDSHHTVGELHIRSHLFGCHQAQVFTSAKGSNCLLWVILKGAFSGRASSPAGCYFLRENDCV